MSASKRPSTSSLRRFITSRPYVTVAELRRRFGLDDPDAMALLSRNGTSAWVGLPPREAAKLQELWNRDELGIELSVEVRAAVVVGVYPLRIARYVVDGGANGANGSYPANGAQPADAFDDGANRHAPAAGAEGRVGPGGGHQRRGRRHPHEPRPMPGAPNYGPQRFGRQRA